MGYGTTLALDANDDLKFDPATNTFLKVNGSDNMEQAIKILLKTLRGEIRFYPDFGINMPQLLDRTISDDNIKHAVTSAIIRDPRVKSIDSVSLERENRTLTITMSITTYDGAVLDFRSDMTW